MTFGVSAQPIEECASDVARLVGEAFAPPSIEMGEHFLRWILGSRGASGSYRPFTALGRLDGEVVSFMGAPTRPFRSPEGEIPVAIPSWHCVAPAASGKGFARATLVALITEIHNAGFPALTFAIEGSRSASLIESIYLEHGFVGGILPAMLLHGAARAPGIPTDDTAWMPAGPVLALSRSCETTNLLLADPRGALDLGVDGAIAVTAWQRTEAGRRPVLLLEHLPEPLTPRSLAEAIRAGLGLGATHARQLLVPNLPEGAEEIGRLAGLRRLPGTVYRSWLWAPSERHPAARCRITTHPIT